MDLHAGHHVVVQWLGMSFNIDTIVNTWIVMAIVIVITLLATRKRQLVPSGIQNVVEAILEELTRQLSPGIEKHWSKVSAILFTFFLFIFVANQIGLLPTEVFSDYGLLPYRLSSPTADVNTTLALAVVSTIVVWSISIYSKGLGYFKHFVQPFPPMIVLNIFEEVAKPITLTVRLFGNIIAGEILLEVLYYLLPTYVPLAWIWLALSLFIGTIQAFIFTVLTAAYLNQGANESH